MRSVKKKEDIFFDLLIQDMDLIEKTAVLYHEMMHDFTDVELKAKRINEMEQECDRKSHEIIAKLNTAFITPFDREDIFMIVKTLDDIPDTMEVAASWFVIYDTHELRDGAVELADLLFQSVGLLVELFHELPHFKKSARIKEICIEINRVENESDVLYRTCLYRLFREESSTLEIIKWKQLYKLMEDTVDVCESIAHLTEGVVMKHA